MADLECPYCGEELDVNHDDGYGYEEGIKHQMECKHCGKSFVFETSLIYYYEPSKADCLNGDEHDWKPSKTFPKECTKMICSQCGEERTPTFDEMTKILES